MTKTKNDTIARSVARVASMRVLETFGSKSEGMVRLRGFKRDEVSRILERLAHTRLSSDEVVFVVLAEKGWDDISTRHLKDGRRSATSYRNEEHACVFFEIESYSDAQGLRNVVDLTDGNLLGEGIVERTSGLSAFECGWKVHFGEESETPATLESVMGDLLRIYADLEKGLALRQWISFVDAVCRDCPKTGIVDGTIARRAVAQALPELGMFADLRLSDIEGVVPRRRRLQHNRLAGDDRTSSGKPIDRDELLGLVHHVTFHHPDGSPLSKKDDAALRRKFESYFRTYKRRDTRGIDYSQWLELFGQTSKRRGLGQKIRDEIEESDPTRLADFDELGIESALDDKELEAAQSLLDADADDPDAASLFDLLSKRTQKALLKVANPRAKATRQPLRHLLGSLHAIRDQADDEGGTLCLEVRKRHGIESNDSLSRALFGLLYGPTLRAFCQYSVGTEWKFEVEPSLLDPTPLKGWFNVGSDRETDAADVWGDLRLTLRWKDESGLEDFFEWRVRNDPGFVALAMTLHHPECRVWSSLGDFDSWCQAALEHGGASAGVDESPEHPIITEWSQERASIFGQLAEHGLDADTISAYLDYWSGALSRLQLDHVPRGVAEPVVAEFLSVDVFRDRDETPALLATHPLRLRWIRDFLVEMREQLMRAWCGELKLNSRNDSLFFERLANFSPHEQPSIFCDDDSVHVAVREECWHELFEIVKTRERTLTDWLSDLDDSSLDLIAETMGMYVDAHPFKVDGLHIYFAVREGGARIIRRVLDRFLGKRGVLGRRMGMQLTLHVACPKIEMGRIAETLVPFIDPTERSRRDLPSIRTCFHEWDLEHALTPPINNLDDASIDLAIVPNLFSATTRCQEQTQKRNRRGGVFQPLLDRTTIRESVGDGIAHRNVSREMLPELADDLLESWSTVNVRHFRAGMVNSDGGADSTDFIRMTVEVSQGAEFFRNVHEKAQWVVTLDAFVGREQIEALEHRPQVISVQSDLGKGGAYTLLVSSKAGRDFVVHRLARRLAQQLGDALDSDEVTTQDVAERLYDHARALAPSTLLRALGLGRVAQELVGLIVSKNLVSKQFASISFDGISGFESWIALDEHTEWFGGNSTTRADLLRVVGRWLEGDLVLDLTVVEAKLRSHTVIHKAERQVEASVDLCNEAFLGNDAVTEFRDAKIWRRALLDAIDESARELNDPASATFRCVIGGEQTQRLPPEFATAIREGRYRLEKVEGVVCSISEDGPESDELTPNHGYRWLRVSTDEVAELLREIYIGLAISEVPSVTPPDTSIDPPPSTGDVSMELAPSSDTAPPPELDPPVVTPKRGKSEAELNALYQRVLNAFTEYDIEVTADANPIQEGPGFYVIRVVPGRGVSPSTLENKLSLLKLKLGLTADLNPRAYIDLGAVVFEVPKRPDERYYVNAEDLWARIGKWPTDRLETIVGENVSGEPVSIDFSSSETPHLLIGGITGSGKSVALETLLIGLVRHYTPEQLQLVLVDPKGTELGFLERYGHVHGQVWMYPDEAIKVLEEAVDEMDRRYAVFRAQRVQKLQQYNERVEVSERLPWRVVVLDEFADLTSDKKDKSAIESSLQRLAQKARACGIHVIVATQKPSAEVINSTVRSNLGAQLALRVKTSSDSRIIMDETGAEALAGNGDAFLKDAGGVVRLQCAWVPSKD